jgi:hypothetical protein
MPIGKEINPYQLFTETGILLKRAPISGYFKRSNPFKVNKEIDSGLLQPNL